MRKMCHAPCLERKNTIRHQVSAIQHAPSTTKFDRVNGTSVREVPGLVVNQKATSCTSDTNVGESSFQQPRKSDKVENAGQQHGAAKKIRYASDHHKPAVFGEGLKRKQLQCALCSLDATHKEHPTHDFEKHPHQTATLELKAVQLGIEMPS
mmetsp:Transcript_133706/g.266788  ORF Transcript_133706/g.266788 Transcript_133706/m.266788 type:complete len:152 (-) Transcript_133706:519-974(-)